MKILSSHGIPSTAKEVRHDAMASTLKRLVTIALSLVIWEKQCEQFWADLWDCPIYLGWMAATSTLLCIHRDPAQLAMLRENGYELLTATNGSEGLQLLMSRSVDAIVLEYPLSLMDGAVVATEIKKAKPQIPIVMLADHLDLPDGALKSVDALVSRSDGAHFLWATVHFVLNVRPTQRMEGTLKAQKAAELRRDGQVQGRDKEQQADARQSNA
jgi:CheY-like chemotaxis protein